MFCCRAISAVTAVHIRSTAVVSRGWPLNHAAMLVSFTCTLPLPLLSLTPYCCLQFDLMAGITVGFTVVPQGMVSAAATSDMC